MVDKHFPRGHAYAKIFNWNTLKVSYSCMPYMATIVKNHNNSVLKPATTDPEQSMCNCRNPQSCPLNGECQKKCVIYLGNVTAEGKDFPYYGSTGGTFKKRYGGHTHSFRHVENRNDTELAKFVWDLKDREIPYSIEWSIVTTAHPYVGGSRKCDLCLTEKMCIARSNHERMLNKHSELLRKCPHRRKYLLTAAI